MHYCAKVRAEAKKRFLDEPREETLATQARKIHADEHQNHSTRIGCVVIARVYFLQVQMVAKNCLSFTPTF